MHREMNIFMLSCKVSEYFPGCLSHVIRSIVIRCRYLC